MTTAMTAIRFIRSPRLGHTSTRHSARGAGAVADVGTEETAKSRAGGCVGKRSAEFSGSGSERRLPGAEGAGVDMHEIRLGGSSRRRPTASRSRRRAAVRLRAREAHVDGAALEVEAVLGDAARDMTQRFVRLRRAVAGDHLEVAAARRTARRAGRARRAARRRSRESAPLRKSRRK